MALPTRIGGLLLDIDGTVMDGEHLVPGVDGLFAHLRESALPFRLVTNITSRPLSSILAKLHAAKLKVGREEILSAPVVTHEYLLSHGLLRCFPMFKVSLREDFPEIEFVEKSPQAVVVGDMGEELNYAVLNRAFRFILEEGAVLLTLARNRYFRGPDGLCLDVGATVAALEYGTQKAALLMGKPSPTFFEVARKAIGVPREEIVVIGDDLEADVGGAQAAGYAGILVRTGKFRAEQLSASTVKPDAILESLGHWMDFVRS